MEPYGASWSLMEPYGPLMEPLRSPHGALEELATTQEPRNQAGRKWRELSLDLGLDAKL